MAAVLWWKLPKISWRKLLVPLVPFVAAGLGMVLLTKHFEQHFTGAEGAGWTLSLAQRCVLAGQALWLYASKLAWPDPIVFFYEKWPVHGDSVWAWCTPIGVVLVLATTFALRNRISRGPFVAVRCECRRVMRVACEALRRHGSSMDKLRSCNAASVTQGRRELC